MSNGRPWYREPETFIAVAALIVSVTAVVVGVYEAVLQRRHDRAEVWPHLEIQTWTSAAGVKLQLVNTGLGPGLVRFVSVTVDGKPQPDWSAALATLYGHAPPPHSNSTVFQHAVRGGDSTLMVGLPASAMPTNFSDWIGRIVVRVCYASVFDDYFSVLDTLGKSSRWETVSSCPAQPSRTDL